MVLCILVLLSSVGLYSLKASKYTQDSVKRVYQLKADVYIANVAIRNAALAADPSDIEVELAKPVTTTVEANRIIEYLVKDGLTKEEQEILKDLIDVRAAYKIVQKDAIGYARVNDDKQFWEKLPAYQSRMDLYIKTIDNLILAMNHRADIEYERLKSLILMALVFGITLVTFALWRVLR
jgi:nitrate/nitrite-specific signal transduction histidine kinase